MERRPRPPRRAVDPSFLSALLLLAIVAVAAWLRFTRISWGLDDGAFFFDETFYTSRALAFVPLSWSSFDLKDFTYPTLYGYLGGLATLAGTALGLLPRQLATDTPVLLLLLRAVSAWISVNTVLLVAILGRRMYSARVGLAAAALMAVVPLHAMHAHIAAPDSLLTACTVLVLLACLDLARRGTAVSSAVAGVAAGLSFTAKYTGLASFAPVLSAAVEAAVKRRSLRAFALVVALALGAGAVTVGLVCAPCALRWREMLASMNYLHAASTILASDYLNHHLVPTLGWYGRPYLYQLVAALPFSLGWPLYVLALLGVCRAAWHRELADRVLLAGLLPYFAVIGRSQLVFPRYLMPLFPPMVLLAARAACGSDVRRRTGTAVLLAVFAYSFALAASQVTRFSTDQQRSVARWIAEQVPHAAGGPVLRVGVVDLSGGLGYDQLEKPLTRAGFIYLPLDDGHWFDGQPDVFVLPEWKEISVRRDRPDGVAARQLSELESGAAGYRLGARFRSTYLQSNLYTWLDPAFASDLWQGEIGFSVYVPASHAPG